MDVSERILSQDLRETISITGATTLSRTQKCGVEGVCQGCMQACSTNLDHSKRPLLQCVLPVL
jgi:hypothetical protein